MFHTSITRPFTSLISTSLFSKLNLLHTISSAFCSDTFVRNKHEHVHALYLYLQCIISYYTIYYTSYYHIIPSHTASYRTVLPQYSLSHTHTRTHTPTFFHGKEIMVHINSIKINFLSKKAIRNSPLLTIFIHLIVFYFHTFYINTNLCLLLQF